MKKAESQFTDTTYRKYQNSNYEKTADGWVKKVEETSAAPQEPVKKEYTDEELAEYAKKASDESLRKAGAGRDERMRVAAKKELLRRKNEGMPEPEKSDNPFDEGLEKGLFDEFPIKTVLGKEYINKGQGWEPLEKGRRASIGEVRTWSGERYQRTKEGWKYIGKANEKSNSKEDDPEAPRINTKAQDYSLEEVTIKEVAKVSDKEAVKHLLNRWDKSGAMADAINSGEASSYKYIVGVETKYGAAAYVWADEGVHYPSSSEPVTVVPEKKDEGFAIPSKPEFVEHGTIDPGDDPDWEKTSDSIDWDRVDLARYVQRREFLGKMPSGKYGVKYFSPNGKRSSISELGEADYTRLLNEARASVLTPGTSDKPWPEAVEKLTSRSHSDLIDDAAVAAAETMFNDKYPDPEVYYAEQIEEDKKHWSGPTYPENENEQAQWKAERKRQWIGSKRSGLMGWGARTPISKTAQIANIKKVYQDIATRIGKSKAEKIYSSYLSTSEGTARAEGFKSSVQAIATEFVQKKREIRDTLAKTLVATLPLNKVGLTGEQITGLKYFIADTGLRVAGVTPRGYDDVEVYFDKGWRASDSERVYKVQTTSWGSIEPGAPEISAMALQLEFLTNPEVRGAVQKSILDYASAQNSMFEKRKALDEEYSDLRTKNLADEAMKDFDWE